MQTFKHRSWWDCVGKASGGFLNSAGGEAVCADCLLEKGISQYLPPPKLIVSIGRYTANCAALI